MNRRIFILIATVFLSACTTLAGPDRPAFSSDRISVTTVGSGPDVVLIPGLGSSPTVWQDSVRAVPGYRYHLVQVAGFAGAPVAGNAGSGPVVHAIAHDIHRYIEEQGLQRPALVGHSLGGTLAMTVAAHHPDSVSRLMVVDMVPFLGAMFGGPASTRASVAPIATGMRDQIAAQTGEARRAAVTAGIAGMIRNPAARPVPLAEALSTGADLTARAMHDLIVTDLRAELARFKGPLRVLYVRGPNIPVTDAQMDAVYQAQFAPVPQATLRRVSDSYHFIMLDQPAVFAEELRSFLSG